MQIWKSADIQIKILLPKISHYNTVYFLIYKHPKYMKYLFPNLQKQLKILRIKNAKFSG